MKNKKCFMPFCILTFSYDTSNAYQKEDKYYIKYTNVIWELKSLRTYNGLDVYVSNELLCKIYDGKTLKEEFYLMDNIDSQRKVRVEYKL